MNSESGSAFRNSFRGCATPIPATIPCFRRMAGAFLLAALVVPAGLRLNAQPSAGTVTFANNSASKLINGQIGSPINTNDHVQAALYWAPTESAGFVQIGAAVAVGVPLPGLFAGGTRTTGSASPGGTVAQFQVKAWSGGYATYEQAQLNHGVLLGQSAVLQVATGNPSGAAPTPPGSLVAGGLQVITLYASNPCDPPRLICAPNKTVECSSSWSLDPPAATDGCTGTDLPVWILNTLTNGQCPQVIVRTWAATNSSGNGSATCTQIVTVLDTTPPILTGITNKTVECGSAWSFDPPYAWDACSGSNVVVIPIVTTTNGNCPCTITRTWLATDVCGNTNTCTQIVTVLDTTPPILTGITNKTVECGSAWSFDPPYAWDACSGSNVVVIPIATTTNGECPWIITRTWLATDTCGNTNSCMQIVTLIGTAPPVLTGITNKTVECGSAWEFDLPSAIDPCTGVNLPVALVSTLATNSGYCGQIVTRTWAATNLCNTNVATCSQTVLVTCSNCPALAVVANCPPNPVPVGGMLMITGMVTNAGNVTLTNVVVFTDQPSSNTIVLGPLILEPGIGVPFTSQHRVAPCGCGPFADNFIALGFSPSGVFVSNSVTTACSGTNSLPVPGDLNGDSIVDQEELGIVLSNYWAHSASVYMTNPASLRGGIFQFALTNTSAWNFTVLVSTNFLDWTNLPGPAYPVYQFFDPDAASNAPSRYYRLRWP